MITLDEKNHVYTIEDGRTPPSVTQVLNLYFPFPVQFMPTDAAEIGTIRHQWFHALAQGLEVENDPAPRISGEVAAFRRFMCEVKPVFISGEVPYYDEVLHVCGKPDLLAKIAGRLSVIDYKPATKNKRTIAQTAAYCVMLRRNWVNVLDRYALRLYDDGKYRLDAHKDDGDLRRWPALVAGYMAATFYR
jgi:hypothetical protein